MHSGWNLFNCLYRWAKLKTVVISSNTNLDHILYSHSFYLINVHGFKNKTPLWVVLAFLPRPYEMPAPSSYLLAASVTKRRKRTYSTVLQVGKTYHCVSATFSISEIFICYFNIYFYKSDWERNHFYLFNWHVYNITFLLKRLLSIGKDRIKICCVLLYNVKIANYLKIVDQSGSVKLLFNMYSIRMCDLDLMTSLSQVRCANAATRLLT